MQPSSMKHQPLCLDTALYLFAHNDSGVFLSKHWKFSIAVCNMQARMFSHGSRAETFQGCDPSTFGHYGRLVLGFWQMFQTVLARVLAILATVSATSQLGGSSEDPAKGCGKVPNRNASHGRKSP